MVNAVILFVFPLLWRFAEGMQCYQCEPDRSQMNTVLCQHFNQSHIFVKECPLSTMCYKKIVHLDMPNGLLTTSIQRGCAAQTRDGDQEKVNGKWRHVNNIYEAYEEGCTEDRRDGVATRTTHCYCRGHLCNGGRRIANGGAAILGLSLIFSLAIPIN